MKRSILKRITAVMLAGIVSSSFSAITAGAESAAESWDIYNKAEFSFDGGVQLKLDDLMPPARPDDYLKESLQAAQETINNSIKDKYQEAAGKGVESLVNYFTKSKEIKDISNKIDLINQEKQFMQTRKGLTMFRLNDPFAKEQYNYLAKLKDKGLDKKLQALNDQKTAIAKGTAKTGIAKTAGKVLGTVFTIKSCYDYYDKPNIGFNSPTLEFLGSSVKAGSAVAGFFNGVPVVGQVANAIYGAADIAVNNKLVVEFCNRNEIGFGFIDDTVSKTNDNIQYLFEWMFFGDAEDQVRRNEEELRQQREKYGLQTPQGYGVGVYKPNIYLYPTKETEVNVSFGLPDLLTKTIPDYGNGWTAQAAPNGSLNVNGEEYGFLFYESQTYPHYWQKEEGFVIPSENREEVFRSILTEYGLNETEISDFCEFWCEKLDKDTDYAMYPQLTEAVDAAMPVDITPAPDTVIRLWFAFSPEQTPTKAAVPQSIPRNGFTVIEWGGLFL